MPPVEDGTSISKTAAVSACGAMAVFYVAVLYAPTGLLRMSTPVSRDQYFLRRFVCAAVSTVVSVAATVYLLRLGELEGVSAMLRVFGLRSDHLWKAVVIPLSLTSLIYLGSFVCKLEACSNGERTWISCVKDLPEGIARCARNVMSWRNYFVVRDCFLLNKSNYIEPYNFNNFLLLLTSPPEYSYQYIRVIVYLSCVNMKA